MNNKNKTPHSLCSRIWLPVLNFVYRHICLPIRRRHKRRYARFREEALKQFIYVAVDFDEKNARTSFTLKVHEMIIDSLPDATDENAVKNLVAHCNYLRVINRHNINYAKL